MCSSINLTYQSATYPAFIHGPEDAFLGRLILHSMQLAVIHFNIIIYVYIQSDKKYYRSIAWNNGKSVKIIMQ